MSWIDDIFDAVGATAGSETVLSSDGPTLSGGDTAFSGTPWWRDAAPAVGTDDGPVLG